jgi:hypothetical protein
MKKPILVFSCADKANFPYSVMMFNSLYKFHPTWPCLLITDEKDPEQLKKLPKNVEVKDLIPYITADKAFFYRQKPIIAEEYIKDYDLLLGLDSDQIITGDLSYIQDTTDYDVGTVINWNRIDPQQFGLVQGWGIQPPEYFNCGLVAMRSEKFIHHWKVLCFTPQFERLQYKEQDLLNILCYYGNYNVRCFDHGDKLAKMTAWWGLISKGEWLRAIVKDNKIIIPKGFGPTPFPDGDMELKVIHMAEGNRPNKMNYRTLFNEDVITRLDYLTSDGK